jgi:hypothetical protein
MDLLALGGVNGSNEGIRLHVQIEETRLCNSVKNIFLPKINK